MLAPVALIGGLALAGGGFDVSSRHIAGLAVWLVVVALLVFGAGSAVKPERPFYWAGGLIVCLALLSAISSLWSGSVELSVIEADRVAGLPRVLPCRVPHRPNRPKAPTFR